VNGFPPPFYLAVVGAAAAVATAYVMWRKLPAERRDITITSADKVNQMTLRFSDHVNDDNVALRAEIAQLRSDFDQYRADTDARLAEHSAEVRAARAGEREAIRKAEQYVAENESLKQRVTELEGEVARLKRRRT
jgi:uncharacterized protein involved in exopolysaccharide biosynthesis